MAKELSNKMRRFCDEYLIDLNATAAAIRAGYKPEGAKTQGYMLMKKPHVKAYIDARMAEKEKELIATQDEVLKYLTSVMRGTAESEMVMVVNTGNFTSEVQRVMKTPDEKEKLKAGELLGKRYGLFTEKVNVDGNIPVTIVEDVTA